MHLAQRPHELASAGAKVEYRRSRIRKIGDHALGAKSPCAPLLSPGSSRVVIVRLLVAQTEILEVGDRPGAEQTALEAANHSPIAPAPPLDTDGPIAAEHTIEAFDVHFPATLTVPVSATSKPVYEMRPSTGRAPLRLMELWDRRELLGMLTWRDVKVRYKQSVIGVGWAVLQPLLMMVVLSVFLNLFAKVRSPGVPYPLLVYAALIPWSFIAGAMSLGGNSLVNNQQLLTKVYFPRLLIPTAAVTAGLVDLGFAMLVLVPLMLAYGKYPGLALLALPLALVMTVTIALGAAYWLSAVNVVYRDVRYTVVFLTQLLFYLSPIAYSAHIVPYALRPLYGLNPVAGAAELFRAALLNTPCDLRLVGVSLFVAVFGLVSGALVFRRMERSFADVV